MSYIENAEAVNNGADRALTNEVLIQVQKEFFQEDRDEISKTNDIENEKLKAIVIHYLNSKGVDVKKKWVASDKLLLNELPPMALHGLTLKAEELGKKITYTQSITIKISD